MELLGIPHVTKKKFGILKQTVTKIDTKNIF